MHNLLNYVTNTFLLVSSSVQSKQLLRVVHCLGQKKGKKNTTKNFVEFHNHSLLFTMIKGTTTLVDSKSFLIQLLFLQTVCFTFILCSGGLPWGNMSTVKLAQIENNRIFFNHKPFQFSDKVKST